MNRRSAILLGAGMPAATGLILAHRRGIFRSRDSEMPLAKNDAEKKILGVLSEAMRSGDHCG